MRLAARLLAIVGVTAGAATSVTACRRPADAPERRASPRASPVKDVRCFSWSDVDAGVIVDRETCPSAEGVTRLRYIETGRDCGGGTELVGSAPAAAGECCYDALVHGPEPDCYGRPLEIDGLPVVAEAAAASLPWSAPLRLEVDDVAVTRRDELASEFARAAVLEHASIASFARWSIELMKFGAPSELIEDTHRAALDEIRHARISFAFAGAFGSGPRGPGALPIGDVLPLASSRAELSRRLVVEGCVDETIAAVTLAGRAEQESDPFVRAAIAAIAEDEERHAELAWRALRWLIESSDAGARAAAREAFASASRRSPIACAVLADVILPAARALLGDEAVAPS